MYHVLYIITCKVYAPPFTWCRLNLINLTFFTDYSMVLSIIDPTLHENDKKLKCLLFNREKEKLPFLDVGKIVRLHRLKVGFLFYLSNWLGWSFCWLSVIQVFKNVSTPNLCHPVDNIFFLQIILQSPCHFPASYQNYPSLKCWFVRKLC